MTTRRNFIKETGLLAASLALAPSLTKALAPAQQAVGIQLYSLREIIGKDVKGVIEKVAKAGFKEVETYGYAPNGSFWGLSPKDFKALLDANGLYSPSGHFGFDNYIKTGNLDDIKSYIDASNVLGSKYVVAPYLGDDLRNNYKLVAERLNKAGELCIQAGINVGYHNHGFEFDKQGDTTGFEILLAETDPNLVYFELDLYWVAFAGQNPIDIFKKHPRRFKMWHVKDMDKTNKRWNTEIGNGTIDFKSIFAEAKLSGVKHIYLEQETNYKPDHISSIKTSIDYIKGKLL
ncbi:sugar phosphate isomerase/epimerase family protein [Pedobacter xixiisoli]|uniref:Tat (Twin-arginine translocation) pathway signal sequence n=1 Tax=Pedobacter xixiisoli TaxID=1476464 RepID=A0A286AAA8_9SPHI|nr:sugar phosphate isomerase/epimerase [Pedobacter xixiisoli]SOD18846.1 Tat (twin-arginine translocation) pathway signal sequence [Pedobacter xixiisoli]